MRGAFFQLLHQAAGHGRRLGLDQKMKVFRHQNPAEKEEAQFVSELVEDGDKVAAETVALEQLGATVRAAGEEFQLARREIPLVGRHGEG